MAERCLYGVDKNIFAVDLAKLSLWLATLARDHPFTFLDHSLRHGDSLVGLSREQIASLHWAPTKQQPLIRTFVDARIAEAQALRVQLQGMAASDDVPEKARLLREADEALADVRLMADVVISAFFERDKPKARETLRTAYAGQIEQWLPRDGRAKDAAVNFELRAVSAALRDGERPVTAFHWEIEFPEVFTRLNAGFDAFVGNPPFAGKNTLAASTQASYLPWLLQIHDQAKGNADLAAHFFRRCFHLARAKGTFELLATNSIGQGDTRASSLTWIRKHGGIIFAARKRVAWPGKAAVIVSVVHVHRGDISGPYNLDGRLVDVITAYLFHRGGDESPTSLNTNAQKSFQGVILLGMGFTFDDSDKKGIASATSVMHDLIAKDAMNNERIRPYWGGAEQNDTWTFEPSRFVIDFDSMSQAEACKWPDLMAIVEARVKPERATSSDHRAREFWWQFLRPRADLTSRLASLKRTLVIARNSNTGAFLWMPATHVFSVKMPGLIPPPFRR